MIFSAVVTAISTLFSIRYNDRLQSLKDEELSHFQADAQRDIARANEGAALANERAKSIEQKNIELAIGLEREYEARLKLEKATAPRHLTEEQVAIIKRNLSQFPGVTIDMMGINTNPEAKDFAEEIAKALAASGWNINLKLVAMHLGVPYGLSLDVEKRLLPDPAVQQLIKTFAEAGLPFAVNDKWAKGVQLNVGLRPSQHGTHN